MSQSARNVEVVIVIQKDRSMVQRGGVAATKADAKTALLSLLVDDAYAVLSFDGQVGEVTTREVVGKDAAGPAKAAGKVDGLAFDTTGAELKKALERAFAVLDGAQSPGAVILLANGHFTGPDPRMGLSDKYPVFACATARASDGDVLQEIAAATGGGYLHQPTQLGLLGLRGRVAA